MTFSVGILVLSLIYSLFLNIIFRSKKHVNTPEVKAFSRLIIINLFGLLFELATIVTIMRYGTDSTIANVFYRLYMAYIVVFDILFLDYNYTTCVGFEYYEEHKKRITRRIIEASIGTFAMAFCFPSVLQFSDSGIYSEGTAVTLLYLASILVTFLMLILIVISVKKKRAKIKDFLPFFSLALGLIVSIIIQSIDHRWTVITVGECLALLVMYFTIEDPNIKTIEQLKMAKNEFEKATKAKTDFLSSMSHEIITPLNAIVGFSKDIQDKKDEVPKEVSDDANYIVEASNTLLEIVGNIIDINKTESSKMKVNNESYNIRNELNGLTSNYIQKVNEKNIKLNIEFDDKVPEKLIGDKKIIKEITNNILSNAVKFTSEGYVNLKVTFESSNDESGDLFIICEDTGKGISKENQEKLFLKFERLDTIKDSTISGTGLGLALTKNLVDIMKGKITVESELNKGTTFIIKLPQKLDKNVDIPEINHENHIGKTILVVDDNKLNLKVAVKLLDKIGLKVIECESGNECIRNVKENKDIDAILMDSMMPDMNGIQTLEKLNEIEGFNIPVIAYSAENDYDKYIKLGFAACVSKPFTQEEIIEILNRVIN